MGQAMTDDTESRYLERLAEAAAGLPPESREDLLDEIRTHIAEARAAGQVHDEASLRQLLDRLGGPEEIVAAATADDAQPVAVAVALAARPVNYRQRLSAVAAGRWGGLEIASVLLLTVGGLVMPIIGPIVGLILAWNSQRWSNREKWIATAVMLTMPAFGLIGIIVSL
jgi:uncharacterized membrane protein